VVTKGGSTAALRFCVRATTLRDPRSACGAI
jgi:hypothetical protein